MSLDNYRIQRHLATGGYAVVHQAVDQRCNECVALKFIDKERADDPHHLDDVRAEVDIFSSLDHRYICKFREVIETPTQFIIAMELLAGGTLLEYVNTHDLSDREIRTFFVQLIDALKYMESVHVCHRDLRLDNICLDNRRTVKVIDFGFGHRYDPADPTMDVQCGTPQYSAPEVLRGDPYAPSVDVWSAGVILYAMAAGALPFNGDTREDIAHAVVTDEPDFPPSLGPLLTDLLTRLLTKDPAARIPLGDILAHAWVTSTESASQGGGAPRGAVPSAESPPKGWWARLKQRFAKKKKT
jgi:MAP/microtubule affinity-regulating kinase